MTVAVTVTGLAVPKDWVIAEAFTATDRAGLVHGDRLDRRRRLVHGRVTGEPRLQRVAPTARSSTLIVTLPVFSTPAPINVDPSYSDTISLPTAPLR